jgi:hypothetical protein
MIGFLKVPKQKSKIAKEFRYFHKKMTLDFVQKL